MACALTFLNNLKLYHFCLRPDLCHHSKRLPPLPPALQKLAPGTSNNYSMILGEITFSLLMRTKNSSSTLKSSSLSSPNHLFHSQFIKLQWPEPRFITSNNSYLKFEYRDFQFSSVQFSRSVMSDSLRPHESQHARPPCPSPTSRVHSDSHPVSQWCHPAISSSVIPFSSCPQSLPESVSFPTSQLFTWGGQS